MNHLNQNLDNCGIIKTPSNAPKTIRWHHLARSACKITKKRRKSTFGLFFLQFFIDYSKVWHTGAVSFSFFIHTLCLLLLGWCLLYHYPLILNIRSNLPPILFFFVFYLYEKNKKLIFVGVISKVMGEWCLRLQGEGACD